MSYPPYKDVTIPSTQSYNPFTAINYLPITLTSSVSNAAIIFFVQVSTTDVSGGGAADMKRAVGNDGAATVDATYLVRPMVAGPTTALVLLCAVNDRARELSSIRVARRSRDFMMLVLGVDWRWSVVWVELAACRKIKY